MTRLAFFIALLAVWAEAILGLTIRYRGLQPASAQCSYKYKGEWYPYTIVRNDVLFAIESGMRLLVAENTYDDYPSDFTPWQDMALPVDCWGTNIQKFPIVLDGEWPGLPRPLFNWIGTEYAPNRTEPVYVVAYCGVVAHYERRNNAYDQCF